MCVCACVSPALRVFPDPKGSSKCLFPTQKQSRKQTNAGEVSEGCSPL